MKTLKRGIWSVVPLALLLVGPLGRAANPCIETGPHITPWECAVSGSNVTSGSLAFTELNVCAGQAIEPPTLATTPTFLDGRLRCYISYDCPENPDHWQTNALRYIVGDLYFVPPVPGSTNVACTNTYAAKVDAYPSSLFAWWPGNGNTDELLYTNNAVLVGDATYAAGKVGDGFSFDGNGDYAYAPDSLYLNVGTNQDFAIECWIQAPSAAYGVRYIVDKVGGLRGYRLYLAGPTVLFYMYTSTGAIGMQATVNLFDGAWHHIAVTIDRDSTTGLKIYVDGVLKNQINPTAGYGDLSNPTQLRIGSRSEDPSGAFFFQGTIDEVSFYRCALSESDVQAIYNAGSAGKKWNGSPANGAAIPAGCICDTVTADVGSLTVSVYADTDGDGLSDAEEASLGTDPNKADSDGDGVIDQAFTVQITQPKSGTLIP